MNDIDLSSYSNWDPIGDADANIGFTGTLDGNGYVVKNLTINRPTENAVGLFSLVGDLNTMTGGEVKNLGLENVYVKGQAGVGALTTYAVGNITNCHVSGNISGDTYIGSFVAISVANINSCYTMASINGDTGVGGITGFNQGGNISN